MRTTLLAFLAICLTICIVSPLQAFARASEGQSPSDELQRLKLLIRAAEQTGHNDILLTNLRLLRDLQARSGALDSSMRTGLRVVAMSSITEDRSAMAADWRYLARIDRQTGNMEEAVSAAKRALVILKTTANRKEIGNAMLELLDLLLETGQLTEFKHQSESALLSFKENDDLAGQTMVLYRQGECLTRERRAADGLSLLHLALRNRNVITDDKEVAKIYFSIARANVQISEWTQARSAFDEALRFDPKACASSPELLHLCAMIDEGLGDLKSALSCERKKALARDSLFSTAVADRMSRMQIMYAVNAKENDLKDLQAERQTFITDLLVEQRKNHWMALFCASLSVGVLVLLMLRGRGGYMVRNARLRSTITAKQAKDLQTKCLELERQNLRLTQMRVLQEDGSMDIAPQHIEGNGMDLAGLLVQLQIDHTLDKNIRSALEHLQGRIDAIALVGRNLSKAGTNGTLNLKAHFSALAESALLEHEQFEKQQVEFDICYGDPNVNDLLPLSLLVNELLNISMERAFDRIAPGRIHVTLRRLGEHRCELLYSDGDGGINAECLNNGSLSAELVKVLCKSLNGNIIILKGDTTTLQLTFVPDAITHLLKAS